MHPYPHLYIASAAAKREGSVAVASPGLPGIDSEPPPEFDGPGGIWSPETLLCAAIADCFILTFRAISRPVKAQWLELDCRVEGVLERVDGVTRFTRFTTHATLRVTPECDTQKARALLERAEHLCLISNSVNGERELIADVEVAPAA